MTDGEDSIKMRYNEWVQARKTVDAADLRLSNIRKYGLSIVTGLLTVQGLFEIPTSSSTEYIPNILKLGIFLAILYLIVALVILDRIDSATRKGAAARARVLERQLGMELTEDISEFRTEFNYIYKSIGALYLIFVLTTAVLGFIVLISAPWPSNLAWIAYAVYVPAVAGAFVAVVLVTPRATYRTIDWSFNRYRFDEDESMELWMTNFTPFTICIDYGSNIWKVENMTNKKAPSWHMPDIEKTKQVKIASKESYVWQLSPKPTEEEKKHKEEFFKLKVAQKTFKSRTWRFLFWHLFRYHPLRVLWDYRLLEEENPSITIKADLSNKEEDKVKFSFSFNDSHDPQKKREWSIGKEPWEELKRPIIIRKVK